MPGLSFLAKKSWHTANLNNQEKVWMAEQAKLAEEAKTKELAKQIQQELEAEELEKIAGGDKRKKRLDRGIDWMYEGGTSANAAAEAEREAEEYLLGKEYNPAGGGKAAGDFAAASDTGVECVVAAAAASSSSATVPAPAPLPVPVAPVEDAEAPERKGQEEAEATDRNEEFHLRYEDPMYLVSQKRKEKEADAKKKKALFERVMGPSTARTGDGKRTKEDDNDERHRSSKRSKKERSSKKEKKRERKRHRRHRDRGHDHDEGDEGDRDRDRHASRKRHHRRRHRSRSRSGSPSGSPSRSRSSDRHSRRHGSSRHHDRKDRDRHHHRSRSRDKDDRNRSRDRDDRDRRRSGDDRSRSRSHRRSRSHNRSPSRSRSRSRSRSPRGKSSDRNRHSHHHENGRRATRDEPTDEVPTRTSDEPSKFGLQGGGARSSGGPIGPDMTLIARKREEREAARGRYNRGRDRERRAVTAEERAEALRAMQSDASARDATLSRAAAAKRGDGQEAGDDKMDQQHQQNVGEASFLKDLSTRVHGISGQSSMASRVARNRHTNQCGSDSFL